MAKFTVDLTEDTPDSLDRPSNVEPGWYLCDLDDVVDDPKSGATVFHWKVLSPAKWKGAVIFDRINDPSLSDKDNAAEMINRRAKLLGTRLGLINPQKDAGGQKELDFMDAIGKQSVIHVELRKYKDKEGNDKEITSVKFDGVYPPDHEKIPDVVRKGLELPPARIKEGSPASSEAKAAPSNGRRRTQTAAAQAATQGTPPATPPATIDVSDL